jgi:hypothetical protein
MPKSGDEIYLDEIELELMSVLVKHKLLKDEECIAILIRLVSKLEQDK